VNIPKDETFAWSVGAVAAKGIIPPLPPKEKKNKGRGLTCGTARHTLQDRSNCLQRPWNDQPAGRFLTQSPDSKPQKKRISVQAHQHPCMRLQARVRHPSGPLIVRSLLHGNACNAPALLLGVQQRHTQRSSQQCVPWRCLLWWCWA
jgi:hypothetical protein